MDRSQIIAKVNEVLTQGFEVDPNKLQPGAQIYQDLGIDSLDAVDMLVLLEEKLGRPVDSMQFRNARQVSDIYDIIERMMHPETGPTEATDPESPRNASL